MDIVWILLCTVLVLMMQAGFCCLESGLVHSKNSINVAAKNFADLCVSSAIFWMFGFAIMFGAHYRGLPGATGLFFDGTDIVPEYRSLVDIKAPLRAFSPRFAADSDQ